MATNQGFKSVVPGAEIDPRFLYWTLRHLGPAIADRAPGTTFKEVNKATMEDVRIPVPPLPEQRRIAALLDKADAVRRKRQQAIRLADDLLRSAFLDMFGDPVTNPKEWPTLPIAEMAEIVTGNTPPRGRAEYYGNTIEWIKSDNINIPSHILSAATEGLSDTGRTVARTVPAGSTLMTCIAGSPSCIGNVALTDRTVAFNQQINAIVPGHAVDPQFLYVALLLAKPLVQAASTGSMKGMVSKSRLSSVRLPAPPLRQQRSFGAWVSTFIGWRSTLTTSNSEANAFFGSLVWRAFREGL
jgi:type I restriction enzyme S subunit